MEIYAERFKFILERLILKQKNMIRKTPAKRRKFRFNRKNNKLVYKIGNNYCNQTDGEYDIIFDPVHHTLRFGDQIMTYADWENLWNCQTNPMRQYAAIFPKRNDIFNPQNNNPGFFA